MTEPPPSPSNGQPPTHSLLNEKLSSAPPPPTPESMRPEERLRLAQAKVGLTLKGWRLGRLLGVGPVSAAYEATRGVQDGASQGVVRVMIGSLAKNERARSQFIRAAYAASRFQHPRVIAVSGDGTDDTGAPFVVRPMAEAEPLATLVEREGPISEAKALRLAEQVLDALENLARPRRRPRRPLADEPPRHAARLHSTVRLRDPPGVGARAEQDVLGARRVGPWTAPERCSTSPDSPSEMGDIWGLGACLYFATSKAIPRGTAETFSNLARTPARPLREVVPSLSENFAALVEHALESDPTLRYESAYAMLGDVRRVMAGRKPKLVNAQRPNPSGSYSGPAPTRSSRQLPTSNSRIESDGRQAADVLAAKRGAPLRVEGERGAHPGHRERSSASRRS